MICGICGCVRLGVLCRLTSALWRAVEGAQRAAQAPDANALLARTDREFLVSDP